MSPSPEEGHSETLLIIHLQVTKYEFDWIYLCSNKKIIPPAVIHTRRIHIQKISFKTANFSVIYIILMTKQIREKGELVL